MGRSMCHSVRWNVFRQHLKSIEFLLDSFLFTDELETGKKDFAIILRSAKIAGQVHRPLEAIKYFPDLSDIVAEKRWIRKRWQLYRQKADKVELNKLTNMYYFAL